ncbi:MAG: hypothetical protein ACK5WX_04815, partial [bacterium]
MPQSTTPPAANASTPSRHAAALDAWFATAPGPSRPLLVIAGPCVLEDDATNIRIGETVAAICADLKIPYVFKASFDKANRSS